MRHGGASCFPPEVDTGIISFFLFHYCKCEERCPSLPAHAAAFSFLAESIWNAASFYQESSYLYFPTLQAELAFDISFYFKTSAPSGVFLENLGLKDFVRLELSCESNIQAVIRVHGKDMNTAHGKE